MSKLVQQLTESTALADYVVKVIERYASKSVYDWKIDDSGQAVVHYIWHGTSESLMLALAPEFTNIHESSGPVISAVVQAFNSPTDTAEHTTPLIDFDDLKWDVVLDMNTLYAKATNIALQCQHYANKKFGNTDFDYVKNFDALVATF